MTPKPPTLRPSYDFIVCGGGTSGCVVAGRLAEDENVTVLVLEAGPHNEDLESTHMIGAWSQNFSNPETSWDVISDQSPGIDNRQVKLSRGKFLGGCSGCNGSLTIRGTKQDYDDWGMPGWSGEEFFGYMRKAESFKSSHKPWFEPRDDSHGYDGHLGTEPHDLAPISKLVMESMISKGLPLDHDMFSHGENPHGCGHALRTVTNGIRTTGADFITKKNTKHNIDIVTNAYVDKVLIDPSSLEATGVRFVLGGGGSSGDGDGDCSTPFFEATCSKEVIVSGGAYCSPNILNRSGIGAAGELSSLDIPVLVDLPGVGKNLMDHVIVFMFYETEQANLTTDALAYHGDGLAKSYEQWKTDKTGFLASFPFGVFAYARLDDRLKDSELWQKALQEIEEMEGKEGKGKGKRKRDPMGLDPEKQPSIELFSTECYGGPEQYTDFPILDPATGGKPKHAFAIIPELFGARSRGSVRLSPLAAKDPKQSPSVDAGYLTDPLDLEVLAEACAFANEIVMSGSGTKDVVKGAWPADLQHHGWVGREEWKEYVKQHGTTCYHASGTCKMGGGGGNLEQDDMSVVDGELKVKGVKKLRVVDCSVIPVLGAAHTQMPAYGIGEKAADLIKGTWGLKGAPAEKGKEGL